MAVCMNIIFYISKIFEFFARPGPIRRESTCQADLGIEVMMLPGYLHLLLIDGIYYGFD